MFCVSGEVELMLQQEGINLAELEDSQLDAM